MQVELCSVQLVKRLAMLTDGQIIGITELLDEDGDPTDDPNEAAAFVAGPDAEGKFHEDILQYYGVSKNSIN